jgi:hypothetical protein
MKNSHCQVLVLLMVCGWMEYATSKAGGKLFESVLRQRAAVSSWDSNVDDPIALVGLAYNEVSLMFAVTKTNSTLQYPSRRIFLERLQSPLGSEQISATRPDSLLLFGLTGPKADRQSARRRLRMHESKPIALIASRLADEYQRTAMFPRRSPLAVSCIMGGGEDGNIFEVSGDGMLSRGKASVLGRNKERIEQWIKTRGVYLIQQLRANESEKIESSVKKEEETEKDRAINRDIEIVLHVMNACISENILPGDLNSTSCQIEVALTTATRSSVRVEIEPQLITPYLFLSSTDKTATMVGSSNATGTISNHCKLIEWWRGSRAGELLD